MSFDYRAAGPIAGVFLLALLTACSRTQHDWRVAQQAGTAQAYEVFLQRHPDSELAGVARQRAAQLTEQAAWQQATRANTAAAYQDYLAKYPKGSWSQDARIRMESKSITMQAPQDHGPAPESNGPAAQGNTPTPQRSAPTPTAGEQPASAAHTPAAADRSSASGAAARAGTNVTSSPRAAVQLGAFSSTANAHSAWKQLSSRFRPQLSGLTPQIVPVMSSGRRLYRLEARVADEAAARRLCRQLQQHSQGCLPVP